MGHSGGSGRYRWRTATRRIFANIRRFGQFLFSLHMTEVPVITTAMLAGFPPPLAGLMILWNNLVIDVLPSFALALEPSRDDVMREPPRDPQQPVLDHPVLRRIRTSLTPSPVTASHAPTPPNQAVVTNSAGALVVQFAVLFLELLVLLFAVSSVLALTVRRAGLARLQHWLGGSRASGTLKGMGIGFVVPFCTYSAIPAFVGMIDARIRTATLAGVASHLRCNSDTGVGS